MSSKKEKEIVSHPKVHFTKIINRLLSGIFLYLFCVSNLGGLDNYQKESKNDNIGILVKAVTRITDGDLNISESDLKTLLSKLNNDKGREKFIDLLSKRSNTKHLDFLIKTINLGIKNFSGLSDDVLAKIVNYSDDLLLKLDGDLPKIKNALNEDPSISKAWEFVRMHNDKISSSPDFLIILNKHLDAYQGLKLDLQDLDLFNTYKKIANDIEQGYEILDDLDDALSTLTSQKSQNSTSPNFWKYIQNGKKFEKDFLLPKLRNRLSDEYSLLKNKANEEFGINLDEYDMYSQVQLKYNTSDYFVADQVYVKWTTVNGQNLIDDIVVIENKLSASTRLTTNQNAGKAASTLVVRSVDKFPDNSVLGLELKGIIPINNKWLKIYDSDNGDIITGIEKI